MGGNAFLGGKGFVFNEMFKANFDVTLLGKQILRGTSPRGYGPGWTSPRGSV